MLSFTVNGEARYYDNFTSITVSTSLTQSKISPPNDTAGIGSKCRAVFVTCEVAPINFTFDGTVPTVSTGTNIGHNLVAGTNFLLVGWENVSRFKMINATAANGAVIKVTYLF